MNTETKERRIYTLPAGIAFSDALALNLLEQTKNNSAALTQYQILLPTRRACRNLRESFLRLSNGKPLLLPRMLPIGDVDEDELLLLGGFSENATQSLAIPPAIPALKRRLLLARLILALPDFTNTAEQAIALAGALGRLMDQIYTENLDLADLPNLVEGQELARHWDITVDFLKILSENWPAILKNENMIDAADRRNRLVLYLAQHWENHPPQTPIIAAGSTGSIPATAKLLQVISGLPKGCVILPGLDQIMDEHSWNEIDDSHPQATLKALLEQLETNRDNVAIYDHKDIQIENATEPSGLHIRKRSARQRLLTEMMRPAATSQAWSSIHLNDEERDSMLRSLEDISLHECATQQEEAMVIAMHMRAALEISEQRCLLITPDRKLARRVAMICKRWDIDIDDSAGKSLNETLIGSFLMLIGEVCANNFSSSMLSALLKHNSFNNSGNLSQDQRHAIAELETHILRGPANNQGLDGLRKRITALCEQRPDYNAQPVIDLLSSLETITEPLCKLCDGHYHPFRAFLDSHIQIAEALSEARSSNDSAPENAAQIPSDSGAADPLAPENTSYRIWQGEAGEAASLFLSDLRQHIHAMPDITAQDYINILAQLIRTVTVRPAYGTHPRLAILGQLEARLVNADLIILAGLNEKTWPPEPSADPWMSRPMRKSFGLPSPERSIGLAAHDFAQAFCHSKIVMTRAARVEGAPTTPARWLQRLNTVLKAYEIDPDIIKDDQMVRHARRIDQTGQPAAPVTRPEPRPPTDKRPDNLYVTAIERWMSDPYSIYARYVLKLRKLPGIEEEAEAKERGTIFHESLENFIRAYPVQLPDNAEEELQKIGRGVMERYIQDPHLWSFWWPQFSRAASWFIGHETKWRMSATPELNETAGHSEIILDSGRRFKLSAKADRIDITKDGMIAIIDYKTGSAPSQSNIAKGYSPQITATGAIAADGGFEDIHRDNGKIDIGYLGHWIVSGRSAEPGKEISIKPQEIDDLIKQAKDGITNLANIFEDPQTPYYSLPRLDKAPPKQWQDYAHLARVQEWSALGDEEEAAA